MVFGILTVSDSVLDFVIIFLVFKSRDAVRAEGGEMMLSVGLRAICALS